MKNGEYMGEDASSYTTVKRWIADFKRDLIIIADQEREGHPKSATSQEIVDQVLDTVMEGRQLT